MPEAPLYSPEQRRPHGSLQLLREGWWGSSDLRSLLTVTGPEGTAWICVRGGSFEVLGKGSSPLGDQALEEAPQGRGHSLKLLELKKCSDITLKNIV